jgi:hypothetical protein
VTRGRRADYAYSDFRVRFAPSPALVFVGESWLTGTGVTDHPVGGGRQGSDGLLLVDVVSQNRDKLERHDGRHLIHSFYTCS